ncbi:unnamed protein product [Prorocentrum cordatum]|uniref:Peptidase A2 domain-containing protein n=1 Tax=Prorocentrum cordatum TaxID=2364126 RepID=A0ABN9SZY9_9DINO|nr:unnamed protein product [Polarella glacialis]
MPSGPGANLYSAGAMLMGSLRGGLKVLAFSGMPVGAFTWHARVEGVVLPRFGQRDKLGILRPGGGGSAAALGVVDTGATFSAVSDAAAPALGVRARGGGTEVSAVGVDGRPLRLPLAQGVSLPLGGARLPAGGWAEAVALEADAIAVGDLPALEGLIGDQRPAVLLGLDVLGDRRLVSEGAG